MSKADSLGPAPTFGAVRSARRNAIRSIGGEDTTASVTELPVTVISENPDNPRNHLRNLDEMVETVREVGVILPIVVGTADAYLRDRPDRSGDLDDGAQYVVVDGHRRLEASRRVGLATVPVRVDNARLATDEAILEAAFIANYHRDDMTDLEEAHALKQLVDYYGSQTKASKRLGIAQSTIASKLSLLKLTPELQKDLQTGERNVEHVRNLGKLSPEEQKAKADERAEAARRKAEARAASVVERSSGPADYHAVIIREPAAQPTEPQQQAPLRPSVSPPASSQPSGSAAESIPEPRAAALAAEAAEPPALKRFPYDNGGEALQFLLLKMPPVERVKVLEGLEKDPETQAARVG
ncbi:ParB/RepB/Spo0J family partition protein [Streptomyces olivaceoviridis]|uniref:ParB/RepB/Spo0J family partition protein n=1 Tax=Streptomyces olivaceoviridis TaxID=1921 RepID=UPI003679CCC1